ncbi:hypothetical protein [Kitasatospora sp. NPDC088346]|uniref:hypothetical protein n=1 Tax=Kitasatospora sp. NPDC088346 TaxID=3364073 RepID=UPI00380E3BE3
MILVESYPDAAPVAELVEALQAVAPGCASLAQQEAFGDLLAGGEKVLRVTPHGQWDSCSTGAPHLAYTVRWSEPEQCGGPASAIDCPYCVENVLREEVLADHSGTRVSHTWWTDLNLAAVLTAPFDGRGEAASTTAHPAPENAGGSTESPRPWGAWVGLAEAILGTYEAGARQESGKRLLVAIGR